MVERPVSKELGAIFYISGSIAYKLKFKIVCKDCFNTLIDVENSYELEDDCEIDYFDSINRGSLQKPSLFLFSMVKICLNFFQLYVRPALGSTIKNPSSSQLRCLFYDYLCRLSYFDCIPECRICKLDRGYIFKSVLRILANICLNNFCKMTTDLDKAEVLSKKRKKSYSSYN